MMIFELRKHQDLIHKLRLVFPSSTNFKSFHYFLLKFFVETILDELSAKIHFSGAQEVREKFFFSQMT